MRHSTRISLLIFFLVALMALISCEGPGTTEPEEEENLLPTTLNGTVRNLVSAKGLEGVVMTLGNNEFSTTSTAQGAYTFDSLDAGVYILTAQLHGFRTEQQEVNVRENRTNRADFLLAPASPRLSVTPDTLNFGAETDTLIISLSQINNDFANFLVSANAGWLAFSRTSGSIQGGDVEEIAVSVDRTELETGIHTSMITIATDIGNAGVTAVVEKREPALQDASEWQQVGTGCNAGASWCLHDTMINQKPHDPDYFSLKRDYTEFSDDHPVTWQYLNVFE